MDRLHAPGAQWVADAHITAHGVTSNSERTVDSVTADGGRLTMQAHARADRYAHGVTAGKGMAGSWPDLTVHAVAHLEQA